MSQLRFDLQSHSTCSDGVLEPAAVVARAAQAGVELLALSDHDSIDGVAEAVAAGQELGVHVVPAVEISALDDGGDAPRELHILGYLVDYLDGRFGSRLAEFLGDRERRTLRMAQALREQGFVLDDRTIAERQKAGRPIGRPHLAEAVLGPEANADRLRIEGIDDIGSMIRAYLVEGKPAYRLRETPTVRGAVEAIHDAGGVVVWAHPFWDISDPDVVLASVERFQALGIDGVEAFYVTHTEEQTRLLAACTQQRGLLSTGSADFHGPENKLFSRFMAFETYDLEPNLGPIAG